MTVHSSVIILDMTLSFPNNLKERRFSGKSCFFFKLLGQYSTVIPTAHICFVVAAAVAVIFTVYHSQRYIFKTSHHFECNS